MTYVKPGCDYVEETSLLTRRTKVQICRRRHRPISRPPALSTSVLPLLTSHLIVESMLPTFATPRLRLEPLPPADGDRLHRLLIHPEVRRYLCDDIIVDRAQSLSE